MISNQIELSLIIIIFIYTIFHIWIIFHLKNRYKVKSGPAIGQPIPEIEILDIDRKTMQLNNRLQGEKNLLLFVDMDCEHCNKIINSLKLMDSSVLNNIHFLLSESDENFNILKDRGIRGNFYFLKEEDIFLHLNIKGFPFFLDIDSNNVIEKKGFATTSVIVEYLI
ncbi:hypothetical protein [Bacillus cereus]|uniref:Thioredoxin-like fold domain-containing protein n=1 Tax=Bacillus cereus TaxID=1396 RepID=A0AA44Q7I3_BACCE|nr:hypothetical protein [Bacillus cereus]PFN00484.1 hypothetical protein COJ55_25055 [Bacillus cereus]PFR90753.1 hypothetical protein COK38_23310 [Bacillus cereus]